MKAEIDAALGEVHILVNCAGGDIGASGGKPAPEHGARHPFEDIRALTENNLIGTMLVCQAFVPAMVAAGSGSVVNIASSAAHMGCSPEAVYSTLKAAVVHYTRCLAKELIESGVRINAVSPGPTKTARFQATRVVDPARMDSCRALARSLCRARRDRRGCCLPGRAAGKVRQRAGDPGRWRPDAVPGVRVTENGSCRSSI